MVTRSAVRIERRLSPEVEPTSSLAATASISSPEWVYLLALVLSSFIPLRPLLPSHRHRHDPTCPRRFFPSFSFSSSSLAFGSVAGELQACLDLGMAVRVGGDEWGTFGSSNREGTARTFFFGHEEPGP
uniref:Uncharacterized protein n=1 Tax=Oryza barthii TaxID=65489 RepID=A0A0D3F960_9ORYZ